MADQLEGYDISEENMVIPDFGLNAEKENIPKEKRNAGWFAKERISFDYFNQIFLRLLKRLSGSKAGNYRLGLLLCTTAQIGWTTRP